MTIQYWPGVLAEIAARAAVSGCTLDVRLDRAYLSSPWDSQWADIFPVGSRGAFTYSSAPTRQALAVTRAVFGGLLPFD